MMKMMISQRIFPLCSRPGRFGFGGLNGFLRGYKVAASDLKSGDCIDFGNNKLAMVLKWSKSGTGRGISHVHLDLRDFMSGKKWTERYRPNETLKKAMIQTISVKYLFEEDDSYVMLDQKTYEQIDVPKSIVGKRGFFLDEDMELQVNRYEDRVIELIFPTSLEVTVTTVDDTPRQVSPTFKQARLENGMLIGVPTFVGNDDRIMIRFTPDGVEYVGRA